MENLRSKLLERADNIMKLGNILRDMDRDKDKNLSPKELMDGCNSLGLELTEEDVSKIFEELDTNKSGDLNLKEFFLAVRGCLSAKQFAVVIAVFNKLDADGSGLISIDDLKNGFDFSGCVKASDERKAQIFMAMFDCNQDGKVTKEEFLNAHAGWSVLQDEAFTLLMSSTWKLSEQDIEDAYESCLSEAKQVVIGQVFDKLDKDGSGEITVDDLKGGFDSKLSDKYGTEEGTKRLMEKFDSNKDGKITLAEFLGIFIGSKATFADMPDEAFTRFMRAAWKLSE